MTIQQFQSFFQTFARDDMDLVYSGNFSDELTALIVELNNKQAKGKSKPKSWERKTGFLIAECFQNIVRYKDSDLPDSYFHLQIYRNTFNVVSGNVIEKHKVPVLRDSLNKIAELSEEELKDIYRKTLQDGKFSEKGGAGLGLIEMARKSSNRLQFRFLERDEETDYFYFQLQLIPSEEENTENGLEPEALLESNIRLREEMRRHHLLILYKGIISNEFNVPILHMVKDFIKIPEYKTAFFVMTELLQNISKHGAPFNEPHTGMIGLGEKDGKFTIGGVNFIYHHEAPILQNILKLYRNASKDFLDTEYKRILKFGDSRNKTGASLGVIDMTRRSSKMEYAVEKENEQLTKFTICFWI
jgi:hypothetical protein